uniref:CC-NBS-LRR disease resistance protein n=1 Tax=Cicer arietinum TaxID=3827 RepID=V5UQI0_CICAR|nr:CC-NBS-LRR disease resistance protein [Cicer arietinum]
MAEMAVSFAIDQLLPLLREEAKLIKGVHKEFSDIKDELEIIQAFLKDADKRAAANGDNNREEIKTWVKQVREAAFRIEDIVDEYMIYLAQKPRHLGCAALHHKIGSNSSRGSWNAKCHPLREAALYIEEAEVVGFEKETQKLIDWLVKGREERTVVSVVGMGGQGKTTLAKKVYNSKDVIGHFDCRLWIIVSQSYTPEGLLRDILKQTGGDPSKMDQRSLTTEVRNNLKKKRYVVVFDDVWSEDFWDHIQYAVIDNKNGSKIFITTRNLEVAESCKKSSFIEVLELQPLTDKEALELFYKKAFSFDDDGCCPKELIDVANEIVKKCKGLPLAIVTIGGLLSTKKRNVFEWNKFSENLSLELNKDKGIKEILGLSYDDLPYHLKSCLLYFGIYPEDYEVKSMRMIRQWIAEGFVKQERGKSLEEVAEGYLTELIHRSLVQVSLIKFDGKAKSCRVHDLTREMIIEKFEDLNFCKHIISEDDHSSSSGIIRRLSIRTISDDLVVHIENSHVRSVLVFGDYENIRSQHVFGDNKNIQLAIGFTRRILMKYRLLKVLDFEFAPLFNVSKMLGSFVHLKYLSFKNGSLNELPKSIGMLQNLETLNVRHTNVYELPKEISKLRKLRHLIGSELSLIQLKDGIGEMELLQTLRDVDLGMDGVVEVIIGLRKLKHIRDLELQNVQGEHGSILSSSINEMKHLKKLSVEAKTSHVLDLHLIPTRPMLQKLTLFGKLQKLPEWIPEFQNLLVLSLYYSNLTNDPMQSLKKLQHLSILYICGIAYKGLSFHFQDGWFQKLKELHIVGIDELRYIIIDKGALPFLKKLNLMWLCGMERMPTGIQYLEKLEVLYMNCMRVGFVKQVSLEECWYQIRENVSCIEISSNDGDVIRNSRT